MCRITDPAYSLCKRANARVNHSTEDCSNSHQSNITLQKCDQKKSSDGDTDSGPVNQRFGNQIERHDCYDTNNCGTHPSKKCLNLPILANFFDIMHTDNHENERRQENE